MSTITNDRNWVRLSLRGVFIATGIILLYLLCFGPTQSLAQRRVIPLHLVQRIYGPLPLSFQRRYLTVWARLDRRCSEVRERVIDDMVRRQLWSKCGDRTTMIRMLHAQGVTYEGYWQQVRLEIEGTP